MNVISTYQYLLLVWFLCILMIHHLFLYFISNHSSQSLVDAIKILLSSECKPWWVYLSIELLYIVSLWPIVLICCCVVSHYIYYIIAEHTLTPPPNSISCSVVVWFNCSCMLKVLHRVTSYSLGLHKFFVLHKQYIICAIPLIYHNCAFFLACAFYSSYLHNSFFHLQNKTDWLDHMTVAALRGNCRNCEILWGDCVLCSNLGQACFVKFKVNIICM